MNRDERVHAGSFQIAIKLPPVILRTRFHDDRNAELHAVRKQQDRLGSAIIRSRFEAEDQGTDRLIRRKRRRARTPEKVAPSRRGSFITPRKSDYFGYEVRATKNLSTSSVATTDGARHSCFRASGMFYSCSPFMAVGRREIRRHRLRSCTLYSL